MAGRLSQADLLAGVVAAALLLALLWLGVALWLAIGLAVVAYLSIVQFRPRPEDDGRVDEAQRQRLAFQAARDHLASIEAHAARIADAAVRDQASRIAAIASRTLAAMAEDRNMAAAPLFNDQFLLPVDALLAQYVRLTSRGVRSAGAVIRKTETHDLPMIEQAAEAFYEKLHRTNVVDLAALGDVLEFDLERIATTSFRRFTP